MDNKRKASGANGPEAAPETPDRGAKRRKLQEEFGDLTKGETTKSTTAYGLSILESIRSTTDKSGRHIAPFFENLPSRSENPDYYQQIRLPLSFQIIEDKLNKHEYGTLSVLEGDFKRLVSNAKETHTRQSEVFSDAERVRKAVSNLMVKYNPAYKSGNYQAVATPLPASPGAEADEDEEDDTNVSVAPVIAAKPSSAGRERRDKSRGKKPKAVVEEEEVDDNQGEAEEEEDDEDEEGDDDEDDAEDDSKTPRRRGRGSTRRTQEPVSSSRRGSTRGSANKAADHSYENMSFKDLSFQQAQEKIVDDIIRKKDDGDDFPYFEAFLNLPPRSLKDYYDVIAEPLSLKALQKQVRGQRGRNGATYQSEFKSWTAFEDQASLIWKNAYHYNEDGSLISEQARELEELFYASFKEAKAHVQEPPQPPPKIKLKVSQNADSPTVAPQPKKITIHVGGKASAAASPSPAVDASADGNMTRNGTPTAKIQLEKTRSQSTSAGSPAPSSMAAGKVEDISRPPSAALQPNGTTTVQQFAPPVGAPNGTVPPGPPPPAPAPAPPKLSTADLLEAQKYRPHPIEESDALIRKLVITSHPNLQLEKRWTIAIPASTTENQQEVIISAPSNHFRLQLKPEISPQLEAQQREWKLHVLHDTSRLYPTPMGFESRRNEPTFDAHLRFGMNRFEVSVVAALPKGQKGPHGLTMELEKIVVHLNLLRH